MKRIKLFLTLLLMFCCLSTMEPVNKAKAATKEPYVITTNVYNGMYGSISESDFTKAKAKGVFTGTEEVQGEITKRFDYNCYFYRVQRTGYYEFSCSPRSGSYNPSVGSSEGLWNTLGAVYVIKNGKTVRLAYSTSGNTRFYSTEHGRNGCFMKVLLQAGDEVLFVIRGSGEMYGRYTARLELNEDVIKTKEEIGESQPIWKVSANYSNESIKEVHYFDKKACCILFQLLDDSIEYEVDGTLITLEDLVYVVRNCDYDESKALLDLALDLTGAIPVIGDYIALCDWIYNTSLESGVLTISQYRRKIKELCGIRGKINGYVTTYSANNGMYQILKKYEPELRKGETLCPVNADDYDSNGNVILRSNCGGCLGTWSGL